VKKATDAESAELMLLGARPRLGRYTVETISRLPFAATLALYRLQADLQQNRLGILWILLRPVLTAVVYGTVFFFILSNSARPDDFVPFLLIGVFVFEFYGTSVSRGAKAVTGNLKLVQSVGFPRALLPISTTIEQAIRMVPITLLLAILLLIWGEPIAWSWLLLIPILALMFFFNLGAAFIVARLSTQVRDIQQIIPFANRFLFYTSGVFFSLDKALADQPIMLEVIRIIPTYDFIALARGVLMHAHPVDPIMWLVVAGWSVVAFAFGYLYFWGAEMRYGITR